MSSTARSSISLAAGLQWTMDPSPEKATTPSVMWRNRVSSLLRSFSTVSSVSSSTEAMSLKVVVRMPISSVEATSMGAEKSPAATRSAPSVRRSMGVIMVLLRRKLSSTEMRSPTSRAWTMMRNIWLLRSLTVPRLS